MYYIIYNYKGISKTIKAKNFLIKDNICYIDPKENEQKSPFERKLLTINKQDLSLITNYYIGISINNF